MASYWGVKVDFGVWSGTYVQRTHPFGVSRPDRLNELRIRPYNPLNLRVLECSAIVLIIEL
jgi:hypothetical protein